METPYRSSRIADLSAEDRPREKALAIGVEALTTTELVALLLGSGTPGESVINLSQRILADSGNSLQEPVEAHHTQPCALVQGCGRRKGGDAACRH